MKQYRFLILLFLTFVLSCSSEKSPEMSGQQPQEPGGAPSSAVTVEATPFSVQIIPSDAKRGTTMYLVPQGFTLNDEVRVAWIVNNNIRDAASQRFHAEELKKGDRVSAKAVFDGREMISNTIVIRNSPPVITSIRILPEILKPGDRLSVEVQASDPDEDPVEITCAWTVNGIPAGTGEQLEVPIRMGDTIDITITPSDEESTGRTVTLHRAVTDLQP
ncbi:MAG: hypothetical protein ACOYVJ_03760 [Nitrospirota bacterium]